MLALSVGKFARFCNGRHVAVQSVIPGNRQCLGDTERRHIYFKEIIHQIKDNRKNMQIRPVDWKEYDASGMQHLNAQLQQYDGFAPGRRVFGRTPKMPIGAVGRPIFLRFYEPQGFPSHTDTSGACETERFKNLL